MPLNPPTHHHHHCFKLDSEYLTLLEETNYFANAASLLTDTFLETQVSLAPIHVSPSVGPLVLDTFKFPFYQRLWLLYVKS